MKIALHARKITPTSLPYVQKALTFLSERKVSLVASPLFLDLYPKDFALKQKIVPCPRGNFSDCDAIFSLGGDGTFLDTLTQVYEVGTPILGINMGRLGFLASIPMDRMEEAFTRFLEGKYTLEQRALVHAEASPGLAWEVPVALNEFSLLRHDSSVLLGINCYLDGQLLNTYWADGVIISTPTGSTAYSMSCGGPLLMPGSRNFIITPVNTHNLNVRPFVIPDSTVIELKLSKQNQKVLASLDSRQMSADPNATFTVTKSGHTAHLVQLEGQHFVQTLKNKLNWGSDIRN